MSQPFTLELYPGFVVQLDFGLAVYHLVDTLYTAMVTTQIAIRLDDEELAALDAEVAEGRAGSRSEAVRRGIVRLQREQRYRCEEATLVELARRGEPVYPDLDGMLEIPRPPLD
ncbi:MAG: ribbon-helix-helix domain-containing protein [Acidimicrobiales bacterium]